MELSSDHTNLEIARTLSRSNSDESINRSLSPPTNQRRFSDSAFESFDAFPHHSINQSMGQLICPLCRSRTRGDESACRRCRLTTNPDALTSDVFNQLTNQSITHQSATHQPTNQPIHPEINEALTAFRFKLFAEMTPLISDLAKIVVDYLLWYRDVDDFHIDDRIDVADTRGSKSYNRSINQHINQSINQVNNQAINRSQEHWKWHRAVIRDIDRSTNKLLVGYDNYSRKWDQWIDIQSERLAPYRSMTKHLDYQSINLPNSAFINQPTNQFASPSTNQSKIEYLKAMSDSENQPINQSI